MDSSQLSNHLITGGDDPFLPKLIAAINHATHIDIAVSFIRNTGLELLRPALLDALQRKRKVSLRIITGDYFEITEPKALRRLLLIKDLGAEIKVFESKNTQSFHMKSYIFMRNGIMNGGSAFVGSSNMTGMALQNGLEWNLLVKESENTLRFSEIKNKYQLLFENEQAVHLTADWIKDYECRVNKKKTKNLVPISSYEMEEENVPIPNKVQKEALIELKKSRDEGFSRGLVVLATGMGKTWLSAFDAKAMGAKRVLFVAHREEILLQAEDTFLCIQPSAQVGHYIGNQKSTEADYLFASIQTLGKEKHLINFPEDYFDYIIIDEFHHAAARTYQKLLGHFKPKFMLGLTATPERTDQSDILSLCDDNIVYTRELFDGISQGILSPFDYFGIADTEVDYREIPWRNGKFNPEALLNQLATQSRASFVYKYWKKHKQSKTLAFCVSRKHADFMADFFIKKGIKSASVHSKSEIRRNEAITQLVNGEIQIVFSVDLFNEGVDVPSIDTVLMLRPTESKIIFLQQLGRGLRKSPQTGKNKLVIVDFIGNHISFFRKAEALFKIGVTNKERQSFVGSIKENNLPLPLGCFLNFDVAVVNFLKELTETNVGIQEQIYNTLKDNYGRRPTASEFFNAGGAFNTIRKEYGGWLHFVSSQGDLLEDESRCLSDYDDFLLEVETTNFKDVSKLVLLEALIELDGFINSPKDSILAYRSYEVIQRRRALLSELPKRYTFKNLESESVRAQWRQYWWETLANDWLGDGTRKGRYFFIDEKYNFIFKKSLKESENKLFVMLIQELVNYRFFQYESRPTVERLSQPIKTPVVNLETQPIPYFSDLRIACGHFKSSGHDEESVDKIGLPIRYGNLDPAKHFIARARGNSMNGGKNPIHDGDYLLLEAISPVNAGSNNGSIIAIERQDASGDDQYLLRKEHKVAMNNYDLIAFNHDYPVIKANEDMRTFARFKAIVEVEDLFLYQMFMRNEIPELFGLEFNTGLWQSGHVCPKNHNDQFLMVTLNKQGKNIEHKYHDYFVDEQTFHWQSQNATSKKNAKGKAIINHQVNASKVYLFVRKNKLEGRTAAPFYFCGSLQYMSHEKEKPMSVTWKLDTPLTPELYDYFNLS